MVSIKCCHQFFDPRYPNAHRQVPGLHIPPSPANMVSRLSEKPRPARLWMCTAYSLSGMISSPMVNIQCILYTSRLLIRSKSKVVCYSGSTWEIRPGWFRPVWVQLGSHLHGNTLNDTLVSSPLRQYHRKPPFATWTTMYTKASRRFYTIMNVRLKIYPHLLQVSVVSQLKILPLYKTIFRLAKGIFDILTLQL